PPAPSTPPALPCPRIPGSPFASADKINAMPVTQRSPLETALAALVGGYNRDPFAVLGPHPDEKGRGTVIRAFQPAARTVELRLISTGELRPMPKRDPAGLYETLVDGTVVPDYRLRITFPGDHSVEVDDPYRYG